MDRDELIYSIVLVSLGALIPAAIAGGNVADGLARRNLARELAREGPSEDVPRNRQPEPEPMPGGHAARHVQDDKPAGYSQDPQAASDTRDIQDTVPDPDA